MNDIQCLFDFPLSGPGFQPQKCDVSVLRGIGLDLNLDNGSLIGKVQSMYLNFRAQTQIKPYTIFSLVTAGVYP